MIFLIDLYERFFGCWHDWQPALYFQKDGLTHIRFDCSKCGESKVRMSEDEM